MTSNKCQNFTIRQFKGKFAIYRSILIWTLSPSHSCRVAEVFLLFDLQPLCKGAPAKQHSRCSPPFTAAPWVGL